MSRRLIPLLKKEFDQIFRNVPLIIIVLWAFTVEVYLGGSAFTMDLQDYPIVVLDRSRSPASRTLIENIRSPHFKIQDVKPDRREMISMLNTGTTSVGVIIPPEFQRGINEGDAQVEVITDGTMSVSASIATIYLSRISERFAKDVQERSAYNPGSARSPPRLEERIRVAYNPNMIDAWFSSLFEFFFMITLVSPLVTASLMVREREQKTLEQLFITPASTTDLFLAKIIPTVTIVMALVPLSLFGIIHLGFGTPIRGSLSLFLSVALLYVTTMSSLGIAIAAVARNMAQTLIITMLTVTPMMFLSGIFSPDEATPLWVSITNRFFPLKHFQVIGFDVILKGNGFFQVWDHILWIVVLGAGLFAFSFVWFHRSVK